MSLTDFSAHQTEAGSESITPHKKHVLVTGAFGNVGEHVLRHLLREIKEADTKSSRVSRVTCFDLSSDLNKKRQTALFKDFNVEAMSGLIRVVWGDITKLEDVKKVFADGSPVDAVIHLAAIIPPLTFKFLEMTQRVNVGGTKNLLEACSSQTVRPRFVLASSYTVYGSRNSSKCLPLLRADTPLDPNDDYARHKVESENLVRIYDGEWSVLRIGAVSISIEVAFLPSVDAMRRDKMLFGTPLNQRRHCVHVKDVACAFSECALTSNILVNHKTLLIGGDATWMMTARQHLGVIMGIAGLGPNLLSEKAFRNCAEDSDDAYYYEDWMDTSESQRLLRFQNHTIFDYKRELRLQVPFYMYYACRIVSPLVGFFWSRSSAFYRRNKSGKPYKEQRMTFFDMMGMDWSK